MKISILVPVYNVEKYLPQCIDSIVGQTYQDLEIICIDDGSTDSSGRILDEYAAKDARIKVIHKPNAGYGHSMNMGLANATGEYIGIVESDDYISADMYEKLAEIVESQTEKVDIVKADFYKVSRLREVKCEQFDTNMCARIIQAKKYPRLFANSCNIWAGIYRREFLEQNSIRFLETPGAAYQDTSFYFKALIMADSIFLTEEAFYYYRIDNENSSVNSDKKIFCICEEMDEIKSYFVKRNMFDSWVEGIYYPFMFRAYQWNFYRLHIALRSAFWTKMLPELAHMELSKEFQRKYWIEEKWNAAIYILGNKDTFLWNSINVITQYQLDKLTCKNDVYFEMFLPYLEKQKSILIYGAGKVAGLVWDYLEHQKLSKKVDAFLVADTSENPEQYQGLRVLNVLQSLEKYRNVLVIVAVGEKSQMEVIKSLKNMGYERLLRVDGELVNRMKHNSQTK